MKNTFIAFLIFSAAVGLYAPQATAKEKPITLEKLQEDKDFELTCGCAVTNRNGDFLVFSGPTERASAIVRIDGKRRSLKWSSSNELARDARVGDRFYKSYRSGTTKMRINYRTTEICEPSDDSCEVTKYSIDIRLQDGSRKNTLRNLRGECGC
ncbi:hypothetical protein [Bdellovibrio sp. HCB337]|uniref:hypothetical protein n=1 Tax=Bdellovibrio sp. HCB337 TaxID=3394358 RepID=UPI0039A56D97